MNLHLGPCTHAQANAYVRAVHRHNGPLPTSILRVLIYSDEGTVRGVAIAGAPKAQELNRPGVLEVSRVATDGSRNACSMLYGACVSASRALGFRRLVTYTLEQEAGASLRASGWKLASEVKGESWARRQASKGNEAYVDSHDTGDKWRWEIALPGSEIPLTARVMAIADVYDALRSDRPYKNAISHEDAIAIIMEESGSHFDPALTEVFYDNSDEIERIASTERERLEQEIGETPIHLYD